MKKLAVVCLVVALAGAMAAGVAFGAQGVPSSKAAYQVGNIAVLNANFNQGTGTNPVTWTPILTQQIKTSNVADLFIGVSMECGLYTNTSILSQNGSKATSTAQAAIKCKILCDGQEVVPYVNHPVTMASRLQTLTAQLIPTLQAPYVPDLYIDLILSTMEANAYNFCIPNVGTGVHTIQVMACIDTSQTTASLPNTAQAWGTIGWGSVTIEAVRLINQPGEYPVVDYPVL